MTDIPAVVFDCNETLLDLQTITPTFERLFGDARVMRLWFEQLITYSQALTIADIYVPFTDIGAALLAKLGAARGIEISDADRKELTDRFATMAPHPEVPAALRRLKHAGFRLFTLTDNTAEISGRQLAHAGLLDVFERRFSVDDESHRHKPAPEAYATVGRHLKLPPQNIWLVACHTWDTIGAMGAGWNAALIKRPGNDLLDVLPEPPVTGRNLDEVADELIARFKH
jgi:2-haloacid dehalogenase